jgi:hypothetical protein
MHHPLTLVLLFPDALPLMQLHQQRKILHSSVQFRGLTSESSIISFQAHYSRLIAIVDLQCDYRQHQAQKHQTQETPSSKGIEEIFFTQKEAIHKIKHHHLT